jgi:sulfide:quinone oxidoreductase
VTRFSGDGHCYLETGDHLAARGAGNFYHPDGPLITVSPTSHELHQAKEAEEADWLGRWNQA